MAMTLHYPSKLLEMSNILHILAGFAFEIIILVN